MDHSDDSTAGDDQDVHGHHSLPFTSAQITTGSKGIRDQIGNRLQHLSKSDLFAIYGAVGEHIIHSGGHLHLTDSGLRDLHHKLSSLAEEGHISHGAVTHGYQALLGLAKHD